MMRCGVGWLGPFLQAPGPSFRLSSFSGRCPICNAVRFVETHKHIRNVFDRDVTPSRAGELEAGTRFRNPRGRSLVSCSPSKSDQRCDESILTLVHHGCQHRSGFCHAFTYTYVRPDWRCYSSGYVSNFFVQFELSSPVVHSSCQQY